MWRVRLMFIPPPLSQQPDTTSLHDSDLMSLAIRLHAKRSTFLPHFKPNLNFLNRFFTDVSSAKFHGNLSS